MPVVPLREAALAAIAARLAAAIPDVPVERGRRSAVATEDCPRLVLRMGGHAEDEGAAVGTVRLACEALVEGYVAAPRLAADPDAALEAEINALHARCVEALAGVEIPAGSAGSLMATGVRLEPDAPLLGEAAEAAGGFTWTIAFDLYAPAQGGPYTIV
ncbi:hypothetical protein [Crenalkalicoccus roseus]|uniref:hypothetical protein n=1 Tax=Crenalkalicoccus roseus TaxID=1485588 RepID=UPI00108207D1|nr:hypothetical protein [Crenalkalicoccus roseus]